MLRLQSSKHACAGEQTPRVHAFSPHAFFLCFSFDLFSFSMSFVSFAFSFSISLFFVSPFTLPSLCYSSPQIRSDRFPRQDDTTSDYRHLKPFLSASSWLCNEDDPACVPTVPVFPSISQEQLQAVDFKAHTAADSGYSASRRGEGGETLFVLTWLWCITCVNSK